MVRPFEKFDQFLDLIETKSRRGLQVPGVHLKRFPWRLLHSQTQTQEVINNLLEGLPRSPHFFLKHPGNVVIERKSRTHIMML